MNILTGNDIPSDQSGIIIESPHGDDIYLGVGAIHDGVPHVFFCMDKWEPSVMPNTGECLVGFVTLADLRADIQRQVNADWIATHRKTPSATTAA